MSAVSTWEISIKHTLHPDNVAFSGKEFSAYCADAGFEPLELRDKHVYALETLSHVADASPHSDPFDRILIAQAKSENMSFLTHDLWLPYYNECCIIPV